MFDFYIKPLYVLLIGLLMGSVSLHSQIEKDAELWTGLSLNAPITKDWSLGLSGNWRQKENFAQYKQAFLELEATYNTPIKFLRSSFGYRYIFRPEDSDNSQRWFLDLQLSERFKPFDIRLRTRFQMQYNNKLKWQESNRFFREKIKIAYRKKKKADWIPFVECEFFFDTDDSWKWTRYRLGAGLDWKIKKRQELGLSIRMQHNFDLPSPSRQLLISLSYDYGLKRLFKKKKDWG